MDVHEADGHDVDALAGMLQGMATVAAMPHVLLAQTTFGKGVSYIENMIAWHYLPMSDEQFAQAMRELESG